MIIETWRETYIIFNLAKKYNHVWSKTTPKEEEKNWGRNKCVFFNKKNFDIGFPANAWLNFTVYKHFGKITRPKKFYFGPEMCFSGNLKNGGIFLSQSFFLWFFIFSTFLEHRLVYVTRNKLELHLNCFAS